MNFIGCKQIIQRKKARTRVEIKEEGNLTIILKCLIGISSNEVHCNRWKEFPKTSRTFILKWQSSCCLLQYKAADLTGSHSAVSVFMLHWIESGAGTYSLVLYLASLKNHLVIF